MTKKTTYLTLLIFLCLTGILCLQGYLIYRDFQIKKSEFKADVNTALELTTVEMNEWRREEVARLYKRDLRDTNLVRVEYDLENTEGPTVSLINAKTDQVELRVINEPGLNYSELMTDEKMFETLAKTAFNDIIGGIIIMGSVIGEWGAVQYSDTLSMDMILFENKINKRLENLSINTDYEIVVLNQDSIYSVEKDQGIVSDRFNFKHQDRDNEVLLHFQNPTFNILQRSIFILATCLLVLIATIVSYYKLIKTVSRQKKLAELKDNFIDGMTHELLTPISTLGLSLESMNNLQDPVVSQKLQNYTEIASVELKRLNQIVQNVLFTSLHEHSETKIEKTEFDLVALLEGLKSYHEKRNQNHVHVIISSEVNCFVNTDQNHLRSVLNNLIDNGIKYSLNEPIRIEIFVRISGDKVSIRIKDQGMGIRPEDQENIFNKFYRSATVNNQIKGLGIGLFYSKHIMHQLDGDVVLVESSERGSIFEVQLNNQNHAE